MKNFRGGIFTKSTKKNMEFIKKLEYTLSLTNETLPILNGKNGKGGLVTCVYFGDFGVLEMGGRGGWHFLFPCIVLLIRYMKVFEIDVVDVSKRL